MCPSRALLSDHPELTDAEDAKRIKEMAREVEADETGYLFRATLGFQPLGPHLGPRGCRV